MTTNNDRLRAHLQAAAEKHGFPYSAYKRTTSRDESIRVGQAHRDVQLISPALFGIGFQAAVLGIRESTVQQRIEEANREERWTGRRKR
jgi:hypothetical protein